MYIKLLATKGFEMVIDAFIISMKMTLTYIAFSSVIGVLLSNYLCRKKSRLKNFIENVILLPMFLPPTIIGYGLLLLISRYSFFGKTLRSLFRLNLIFTWQAGAIATFIIAMPVIYQNSKAAFLGIDDECIEAARVEGANRLKIFIGIKLPLALRSILCGLLLGFARAFGEFGATIMVAGNIPGKTQNIPMAIYYSVDNGDNASSALLLVITLALGIGLITLFNLLISRNDY
jgi:molybdate transport system permease protein